MIKYVTKQTGKFKLHQRNALLLKPVLFLFSFSIQPFVDPQLSHTAGAKHIPSLQLGEGRVQLICCGSSADPPPEDPEALVQWTAKLPKPDVYEGLPAPPSDFATTCASVFNVPLPCNNICDMYARIFF